MISRDNDRYIAAIDVGGTTTKFGLVSAKGIQDQQSHAIPTPSIGGPDCFIEELVKGIEKLRPEGNQIAAVGMAVPGFLSADRETVTNCTNVPMLQGYPWRTSLQRRLGVPAILEVDCNAAAMGEYAFGGGQGVDRLLVLSLGTGVGVAMLIDGAPLRFTGSCSGDAGHIYVGGARRCSAGCKGCLEAEVSVDALGGSGRGTKEIISRALGGEPNSVEILYEAGRCVGCAVASLASCFQPDLVLLAGGIAEAGDLLIAPANKAFIEYGAPSFLVSIRKAQLGAKAALAGAAVAFLDRERTVSLSGDGSLFSMDVGA